MKPCRPNPLRSLRICHSRLRVWLCLLPVAYLTSIAATEIVSWLFFVTTLIHFFFTVKEPNWKAALSRLKLGADLPIWAFIGVTILSAGQSRQSCPYLGRGRLFTLDLFALRLRFFFRQYIKPSWQKYLSFIVPLFSAMGAFALLQYLYGFEPPRSRVIVPLLVETSVPWAFSTCR